MKLCSSSYANASRPRMAATNYVSVWRLSIPLRMLVDGKDDAHAIGACARISSIYVGARSFTICMSWLVLSNFRLSFKPLLDFLTGVLGRSQALKKAKKAGTLETGSRSVRALFNERNGNDVPGVVGQLTTRSTGRLRGEGM